MPKPIAQPIDSMKANPSYINNDTFVDVFFVLRDEPRAIAITN